MPNLDFTQPRSTPRQACVVLAIVAAGLSLSAAMMLRLLSLHERTLRAEVAIAANARVELLRSSWLRSLEALHATVAYLEVTEQPTREGFRQFVRASIGRLPEVQAMEWIPRVREPERAGYEADAVHDGLIGFQFNQLGADGKLGRADVRAEYFPVYFAEPPDRNLPALGLDLAAHPLRRSALERARDSGLPAATAPVRLAQETREGELGLLVFAPVRGGAIYDPTTLRGFGLVALRIRDFARPAFLSMGEDGLRVRIADAEAPELALFQLDPSHGPDRSAEIEPALVHRAEMQLAGRAWQLDFAPTPGFLRRHASLEPYAYPCAVLVLSLLIAAYSLRGMRRTQEIERRVRERTRALSHEIAVRRNAEAALRAAEAKYRNIFENALLGIFQSTPEGTYLDANPSLARIYGYASPEELMREVRDIRSQLYVDPEQRAQFAALLEAHGSISDFRARVKRKDGAVIWIAESAVAVRGEGGAVAYYEGSVEDVTARIAAEEAQKKSFEWLEERVRERTSELAAANEQLQAEVAVRKLAQEEAAQARQAQTQFLASMSHEIRTPLNAIIGYSQILARREIHESLHREAQNAIAQGGQHLLSLVDDVMDLSKIEAGYVAVQPADFNLGGLISGLAAMFRIKCEKKGLQLRIEGLGASPRWVRGDEGKVRQVLINLLGNAVKFTQRGEVRLRVVPEAQHSYRFEVIDTGGGIPASEHARVFDQFYQSQAARAGEGAGLGLSISRRLVELMGGRLELRSTPGWGSNFHFSLEFDPPLAVVPSQTEAQHPRIRLAPGARCRALVVDDLEVNRNVLRHMLAAIGCEVECAESGDDALARLFAAQFDIVFLDVLMPGRDGIQTAHAIRSDARGRSLKLVAVSASALESQRRQLLSTGFDAFIAKPFRAERVNDCLAQHLGLGFVAEDAPLPDAGGDFSSLRVPGALLSQIREAASSYQVTRLRQSFEQLERCGGEHRAFAAQLRASAARYDMNRVLDLVRRVELQGGASV